MSGTNSAKNNFSDNFSDSSINDVKSDGDTEVNINDNMADDSRKIFVGGLSWETSEEDLKKYFSTFGEVKSCVIKLDRFTNQSRGFGFVMFDSEESVNKVLEQKEHTLNKKKIDPKRAKPSREPQKKIFIGGLDPELPEEKIKEYFAQFGTIENIETPFDVKKNKRKRYLFITFSNEAEARKAANLESQDINGKKFEVRVAIPRDQANRSKELMWRASVNNAYYPYNILPYMYPEYFYSYIYSHPQMYNAYDYVNYDLSRQFQQTGLNNQGSNNHSNQQLGPAQSPSNQHMSGSISPNHQNPQNNNNRNQFLGNSNNSSNNTNTNDANNNANIPYAYYPYAVMHPAAAAHYSGQHNMMHNNLQKQQQSFQLPNGGIVNKNMNESM